MTPDDKRLGAMAAAGLLEAHEFMHLVKPPRRKRQRRPSLPEWQGWPASLASTSRSRATAP